MIKKLLCLLVLLLTAATTTWANWTGGTYTATTNESVGSITVSDDATLTINEGVTVYTDMITISAGKTLTIVGPGSMKIYGDTGVAGFNGGVAVGGTGCMVIKGNANVTVDGGSCVENTNGNGCNGGAGTTCSVTIYSGKLEIWGGGGGNGVNGGNGGNAFDGSGTLTYYGGDVSIVRGPQGMPIEPGEFGSVPGEFGSFGKCFASTYNVDIKNEPTGYYDGYNNPISAADIKVSDEVRIKGSGADPVPPYYVKMANGVKDADKWTVKVGEGEAQALPIGGLKGDGQETVTLLYNGRLKVKGVTATSDAVPPAPPAEGHALSLAAVGEIICTDGKAYAAADKDNLPKDVTAVAMVCYKNGSHGLALALADESSKMNWSTAISTCEGKTPTVTGCTWKLASKDEWNTMITAAGDYTALRDGFTSVGGTNMVSNWYWSSKESNAQAASEINFGTGSWANAAKTSSIYVRAALAF